MSNSKVTIPPVRFGTAEITVQGNAPLCVLRFGQKSRLIMQEAQEGGSAAKNRRKKEPKDFDALFDDARHISEDGWDGVHAASIRNALISACRVAGYPMTRAKLSIFVEADGFGRDDLTPLIRIHNAEARKSIDPVRNASGVADLRVRAMYAPGWKLKLRLRWDADQFEMEDVLNLLNRAGMQVGIGEGRPDSKKSAGLGYGTFEISEEALGGKVAA